MFIKLTLRISILLISLFLLFLLAVVITDYKPDGTIRLEVNSNKEKIVKLDNAMSITTFNIGFGGLDKNQDFFMDGGKLSRSYSKEKTYENIEGVSDYLKNKNSDFLFVQEIDEKATRTYYIDERQRINEKLDKYSNTYAYNYKVLWVPVPVRKPHGYVRAGLSSFSKYDISKATRYQLPGKESFERQLFLLDRCFIESRLSIDGSDKEFVLINAHLSAYDKGGVIRKQQLSYLKQHIQNEYDKGNYVLVGGDWNHKIGNTNFKSKVENKWMQDIPSDFKPDTFKWAIDNLTPTVRSLDSPYKEGNNFIETIDGFLVSDNIEVLDVKGENLGFEYSDHNPVTMEFKLK
ncbi:endonuclease/exonuclease/phosphatase family protein [Tepidibacter hydrothermalis]|uniref:Endonuclease/exonuclease/phosphatase family protein n=1 Tax=Tepidibacter hydrothermalis TaxID=3036126 RepID=A0ABY8E8V1_9FIRM|nr:endonuclease/exonuclease/phosphatase family protein [Tepidibacter hydrothermalis]WFD09336.1 endonuclease/exonuclease/phosphatase family protein [Tepidibacter hydrothermalis]